MAREERVDVSGGTFSMRERWREVRVESTVEMDHIAENNLGGGATNTADIGGIADALGDRKERMPIGNDIQVGGK